MMQLFTLKDSLHRMLIRNDIILIIYPSKSTILTILVLMFHTFFRGSQQVCVFTTIYNHLYFIKYDLVRRGSSTKTTQDETKFLF